MNSSFILILVFFCYSLLDVKSELVSVISLHRHGAKTIKGSSRINEYSLFDKSYECLTIAGYAQLQIVGTYLKEKYIESGFVDKNYKEPDVKIISSATSRTVQSAAALISGLFPKGIVSVRYTNSTENISLSLDRNYNIPIQNFTFHERIDKVPIYVNKENQIFRSLKCLYKGKEVIKLLQRSDDSFLEPLTSKERREFINEMYSLIDDWQINDSLESKYSNQNLLKLADELETANFHFENDLKISNKSYDIYRKFRLKFYDMLCNQKNRDVVQILISQYFKRVTNLFDYHVRKIGAKIQQNENNDPNINKKANLKHFVDCRLIDNIPNDERNNKLSIFSAHDTTIKATWINFFKEDFIKNLVIKAFYENDQEAFKFLVPEYASIIIYELHNLDGSFYVKIIYNGRTLDYENYLKYLKVFLDRKYIRENMLPYQKFKNLLESSISPNYCKIHCDEEVYN